MKNIVNNYKEFEEDFQEKKKKISKHNNKIRKFKKEK